MLSSILTNQVMFKSIIQQHRGRPKPMLQVFFEKLPQQTDMHRVYCLLMYEMYFLNPYIIEPLHTFYHIEFLYSHHTQHISNDLLLKWNIKLFNTSVLASPYYNKQCILQTRSLILSILMPEQSEMCVCESYIRLTT